MAEVGIKKLPHYSILLFIYTLLLGLVSLSPIPGTAKEGTLFLFMAACILTAFLYERWVSLTMLGALAAAAFWAMPATTKDYQPNLSNLIIGALSSVALTEAVYRLVSSRRQIAQGLKESETRYRQLVELSPDAVVVHSKGEVVYANNAGLELIGAVNLDEIIGRPAIDFVHPDYREIVGARIKQMYKTGKREGLIEEKFIRLDGQEIEVEASAAPITTYTGAPAIQVVLRDITERKRAGKAIQETNAELKQRIKELSTLNYIIQTATEAADLQAALDNIVPAIGKLFNASGGGIAILKPDQTQITILSVYSRDYDTAGAIGHTLPIYEHAIVSQFFNTKKPQIIPHPPSHPLIDSLYKKMRWLKAQYLMIAPLIARGEIFGLIGVGSDQADSPFTPSQMELAETVAGQIAGAIENARLLEEEQRQRKSAELALREAQTLYRIANVLAKSKDMQAGIEQSLGEYLRALNLEQGGISLFDTARKSGKLYALYRDGQPQPVGRPIRIVSRIYRKLIEEQQPVVVVDACNDPLLADNKELTLAFQIKSILFVPLLVRGEVIGVLGADATDQPRHFSEREIILGQAVADQVAAAVENARLYEQARQDADTMSQLLREVNHRVGNNLAAIVGLLSLERQRLAEADRPAYQEIMSDLSSRVNGLAMVHRMLSTSRWAPLALDDLIRQIIQSALKMLPRHKRILLDISPSPVRVSANQAHHLGLIINEMTTNTLKYALEDRNTARIQVFISQDDGAIQLEFRDDGPGYAEDVLQLKRHNVGIDLITNIVQINLEGNWTLRNDSGAVTIIRFKNEVEKN